MLGKPKINNLNFNIRKLEKPRRKEIKIRAEINEIENRKPEKIKKIKSWFFTLLVIREKQSKPE